MTAQKDRGIRPGIGVDAAGNALIDPTANVIALTEAANRRQDDLREAGEKFNAAQIANVKEIETLRAEYERLLSEAESRRIDAIRLVDAQAAAADRTRAQDQASVLATNAAASAETLRSLVSTTAQTLATAQQQIANTLSDRITALERFQYEGKGREKYSDPMQADMMAELRSLRESRSLGTGKDEGRGQSGNLVMQIILGVAAVAGILFGVAEMTLHHA